MIDFLAMVGFVVLFVVVTIHWLSRQSSNDENR